VASSCLSGVAETVDCAKLLGGTATACNAGEVAPPLDWTSPCHLDAPCGPDTCVGGSLRSCARGAIFTVNCAGAGLGPCEPWGAGASGADAGARSACAKR
jgi:hypothetical protein